MSDERLNGIIDEEARRLTEGSPAGGAGFRRRVLVRIESGDAPRRAWRAAFVLSPIAIAAIVMTLFVARGFQPRVRGPERAAPQPAPTVATPTASGAEQARPLQEEKESSLQRVGAELAPPGRSLDRGTPNRATRAAVSPEPALTIDPLAFAPLGVDALAQDSLQIDRLDTIAPITVAPLEIGDAQRRFE